MFDIQYFADEAVNTEGTEAPITENGIGTDTETETEVTADAEAQEAFSDNENEEKGNAIPMLSDSTVQRVKELADGVISAKEFYPHFDIAKELRDPEFAMLLQITKGDPKRAYEMKYHDLILTNAMHYAVTAAESRISDSMAQRSVRPDENAVRGSAPVVITTDPKALTRAQRAEIKKRVRRGEKILW